MASQCKGKSSWPELLGADGGKAVATIQKENPAVTAIIVLEGSVVSGDFRCDRVWVWVNTNNVVTRVPVIGKTSWPELAGVNVEIAVATIERECPRVSAVIVWTVTRVPEDFFTITKGLSEDFRCGTVLVWVNINLNVLGVPRLG